MASKLSNTLFDLEKTKYKSRSKHDKTSTFKTDFTEISNHVNLLTDHTNELGVLKYPSGQKQANRNLINKNHNFLRSDVSVKFGRTNPIHTHIKKLDPQMPQSKHFISSKKEMRNSLGNYLSSTSKQNCLKRKEITMSKNYLAIKQSNPTFVRVDKGSKEGLKSLQSQNSRSGTASGIKTLISKNITPWLLECETYTDKVDSAVYEEVQKKNRPKRKLHRNGLSEKQRLLCKKEQIFPLFRNRESDSYYVENQPNMSKYFKINSFERARSNNKTVTERNPVGIVLTTNRVTDNQYCLDNSKNSKLKLAVKDTNVNTQFKIPNESDYSSINTNLSSHTSSKHKYFFPFNEGNKNCVKPLRIKKSISSECDSELKQNKKNIHMQLRANRPQEKFISQKKVINNNSHHEKSSDVASENIDQGFCKRENIRKHQKRTNKKELNSQNLVLDSNSLRDVVVLNASQSQYSKISDFLKHKHISKNPSYQSVISNFGKPDNDTDVVFSVNKSNDNSLCQFENQNFKVGKIVESGLVKDLLGIISQNKAENIFVLSGKLKSSKLKELSKRKKYNLMPMSECERECNDTIAPDRVETKPNTNINMPNVKNHASCINIDSKQYRFEYPTRDNDNCFSNSDYVAVRKNVVLKPRKDLTEDYTKSMIRGMKKQPNSCSPKNATEQFKSFKPHFSQQKCDRPTLASFDIQEIHKSSHASVFTQHTLNKSLQPSTDVKQTSTQSTLHETPIKDVAYSLSLLSNPVSNQSVESRYNNTCLPEGFGTATVAGSSTKFSSNKLDGIDLSIISKQGSKIINSLEQKSGNFSKKWFTPSKQQATCPKRSKLVINLNGLTENVVKNNLIDDNKPLNCRTTLVDSDYKHLNSSMPPSLMNEPTTTSRCQITQSFSSTFPSEKYIGAHKPFDSHPLVEENGKFCCVHPPPDSSEDNLPKGEENVNMKCFVSTDHEYSLGHINSKNVMSASSRDIYFQKLETRRLLKHKPPKNSYESLNQENESTERAVHIKNGIDSTKNNQHSFYRVLLPEDHSSTKSNLPTEHLSPNFQVINSAKPATLKQHVLSPLAAKIRAAQENKESYISLNKNTQFVTELPQKSTHTICNESQLKSENLTMRLSNTTGTLRPPTANEIFSQSRSVVQVIPVQHSVTKLNQIPYAPEKIQQDVSSHSKLNLSMVSSTQVTDKSLYINLSAKALISNEKQDTKVEQANLKPAFYTKSEPVTGRRDVIPCRDQLSSAKIPADFKEPSVNREANLLVNKSQMLVSVSKKQDFSSVNKFKTQKSESKPIISLNPPVCIESYNNLKIKSSSIHSKLQSDQYFQTSSTTHKTQSFQRPEIEIQQQINPLLKANNKLDNAENDLHTETSLEMNSIQNAATSGLSKNLNSFSHILFNICVKEKESNVQPKAIKRVISPVPFKTSLLLMPTFCEIPVNQAENKYENDLKTLNQQIKIPPSKEEITFINKEDYEIFDINTDKGQLNQCRTSSQEIKFSLNVNSKKLQEIKVEENAERDPNIKHRKSTQTEFSKKKKRKVWYFE